MKMKFINIALACVLTGHVIGAQAETHSVPVIKDTHIQTINYDEDIFKFFSAEGIVTTIEFDPKETVTDYVFGDSEAWNATKKANLLVIKPKASNGSCNLTVFTDKRKYLFYVNMLSKNTPKVAYLLKVRSPDQQLLSHGQKTPEMLEAELEALRAEARKAEVAQIKGDLKNAKNERPANKDYWIVGPKELQPMSAQDDGVETRLTFSAANPLPVAFVVEPDGQETLVDSHMEGDTMVLHRVVEKIMLRRGNLVAGVTNHSFKLVGMSSPTGTISDKVDRVVKGKE